MRIIEAINKETIDLKQLRKLAFTGVPDSCLGLRPVVWRILLDGLSLETKSWRNSLEQNYLSYEDFKRELIVKPKVKQDAADAEQQKAKMDHPLSRATESVWNTYFKDQELWDEIEKDVKRTRSDMNFFYLALDAERCKSAADLTRLNRQHDTKKADLKPADIEGYLETHADVLHRILFIYAKLNPGVKYVQGMNEVLAVLYFCFLKDDDASNPVVGHKYLESDLFFNFSNLMIELRDGFLRELDKEKSGIQGRIKQYAEIMKVVEPHAYHTIEQNQVNHQFYSLRWFMLLLCQEFTMAQSIRLWDTLLTDPQRFQFTNFVCVALVSFVRDEIIDGDFACCMENLQKAHEFVPEISDLLNKTNEICVAYNRHEESYTIG